MKKLRIVLPVFAVMIALGSALATATFNDSLLVPKPVVLNQTLCPQSGECSNVGTELCKTAMGAQYYERASASSCSIAAVGTHP